MPLPLALRAIRQTAAWSQRISVAALFAALVQRCAAQPGPATSPFGMAYMALAKGGGGGCPFKALGSSFGGLREVRATQVQSIRFRSLRTASCCALSANASAPHGARGSAGAHLSSPRVHVLLWWW